MKKLFLILFLLCSCSKEKCDILYDYPKDFCNISLYKNYVVDKDFTASEKLSIKEAFDGWENLTEVHIRFNHLGLIEHKEALSYNDLSTVSVIKLSIINDRNTLQEIQSEFGSRVIGAVNYNKQYLYLFADRISGILKLVAVHEIGHVLGLPGYPHTNDYNSIMTRDTSSNKCILERQLPTIVDYNDLRKLYCGAI